MGWVVGLRWNGSGAQKRMKLASRFVGCCEARGRAELGGRILRGKVGYSSAIHEALGVSSQ